MIPAYCALSNLKLRLIALIRPRPTCRSYCAIDNIALANNTICGGITPPPPRLPTATRQGQIRPFETDPSTLIRDPDNYASKLLSYITYRAAAVLVAGLPSPDKVLMNVAHD